MLRRYLTRLMVLRLLGCLLGLGALLQLLNLLDKAGDILAHGGASQLGQFIGLRLPTIIAEMLPLATLLAAVLTFRQLAGSAEMTAMQAAGIGAGRILRMLLPFCLVVATVQFVVQAEAAPRSERALAAWWTALIPAENPPPARVWLLAHGDVAAVDQVAGDGRRLAGVMIVERAASGDLIARLDAATAQYQGNRWILHSVRVADFQTGNSAMHATMVWPGGPVPENMAELAQPVMDMPLGQLIATLSGRWIGGRGPAYYRTELDGLVAGLLDPLLMVLLAAPVLLVPPRATGAGMAIALTIMLGLGLQVAAGLLSALGDAGIVAPLLAGLAAPVVFGGIGVFRLRRQQLR